MKNWSIFEKVLQKPSNVSFLSIIQILTKISALHFLHD